VRKWLLAAGWIALGVPAWAGDGALEISQACVEAGCFPGDTPGFPIQTEAEKKYVLTSSLVVGSLNVPGVVLAYNAALDLNDFTIRGPTFCDGDPVVCVNKGSGGVDGVSLGELSVLRNGTVTGFGRHGVYVNDAVLVDDVQVVHNGEDGISGLGRGSVIKNCRIHHNGDRGIQLGFLGSLITGNTVFFNAGSGISAPAATIVGNAIYKNGSFGIDGFGTAGYGSNSLYLNNGSNGIQVSNGNQIGGNVCGNDTVCP
jgi:hypothetical protein